MLTASRAALTAALSLSGKIVERRNTIPILSNVLFTRGEKGLALRMTDLDIELQVEVAADLAMDFKPFTVPANLLHEIVRKLPDGADCTLEPADAGMHQMRLKSGRSKFTLQVLPGQDFPATIADGSLCRIIVPAKTFAAALSAVSFAISTEETRYYLNGVFFHPAPCGVLLVATDGHRLAKRAVPISTGAPSDMPGVIIPRKTVGVLAALLPADGDVTIDVSDARITFHMEGKRLSSKLIDGTFPDYQRVIPQGTAPMAEMEGTALKAAVDRASTVAIDKGRGMKFAFAPGGLSLSVQNPDAGTSEETLDYEGEINLTIGFNAKYVLDAINNLPNGTLTMSITDAGSPAILRADGDHTENLVVLMPMRV